MSKEVDTFPKSISLKVNVKTQQEFEFPYFEFTVYLLYNCGMIFLYYLFSLVISYHLVWLGFELFGSLCRCSHSRTEDVTITNAIIKTPDGKWDWIVNDVMTGSDGLGILVIFEKSNELRFDSGRGGWYFDSGPVSPAGGWLKNNVETVSIVIIVSLSLLVSKT